MLNFIEKELTKREIVTVTENGAIGYKSTGSALVDINYKVASLRNSDEDEIITLFDEAFNENPEYALKWLFFARDAREGLGERRLFRICYKRLYTLNDNLFFKNLHNIQEYGRWDDLISLIGFNNSVDNYISNMLSKQIAIDIENADNNKPISLLAKWMPSENASSKETKALAKKVRKLLGYSPRKYRLMLSKLRKHLDVVEVKMCDNKWESIDYEKVPSLANLRYRSAFMRHDEPRRREYLHSVKQGDAKLNMSVATPVDVVTRYMNFYTLKEYDETLELAWKNLPDVMVDDTLVVADGSGSMCCNVGQGNTTALDVANALAIYTSEHNSGIYKNKYITFSNTPLFVRFREIDSLHDKITKALKNCEVSNTNIEAVFDLILDVAIGFAIPKDEMIKNILIISDMEFDRAQVSWRRINNKVLTESLFETIRNKYNEAGYDLPRLIFWNVNSRTQAIPLIENELGVALVSGFSQNVLKMVMSSKYDPYAVLVDTITAPRYDKIYTEV